MLINSTPVNYTLNTSAITSSAASFLGWLPPTLAAIASLLSIIWISIGLYDSQTFRKFAAFIISKIRGR